MHLMMTLRSTQFRAKSDTRKFNVNHHSREGMIQCISYGNQGKKMLKQQKARATSVLAWHRD